MIPLLYTTHNRIEFTKQTLPCLFENTTGDVLFIIIDTGSTDGTVEYLKNNIKKLSGGKKYKLFIKNDMSLPRAVAFFYKTIKNYDFEYAGKIDNDTLVPLNWLTDLVDAAKNNNMDILDAKHYIMNNSVKGWDEWAQKMEQIEYKNYKIYLNNFAGGNGVVFNKKTMIPYDKEYGETRLQGWTQIQTPHTEWKKGFYDGVFIKALDMLGDNIPNYNIDKDYYSFTGRI